MIRMFGIANCDTVKKSRAWLAEQACEVAFHDFKRLGVPVIDIDNWLAQLAWQALVNRQGTSWRKLDATTQAKVVDSHSAQALLLSQPSTIKRPVVEWPDGTVTVGFNAEIFAQRLKACR